MVAVTVFAMTVTAMVGSFLAILRINEKARAIRTVEQNVRFISDYISREVRNGELNYSAYSGGTIAVPNTDLNLINSSGEQVRIYRNGNVVNITKTGIGTSALTGGDVIVSNLQFFIRPATTPFCASPCSDQQPYVTYVMTLQSNINIRPQDQATMTVQNTLSFRNYPEI